MLETPFDNLSKEGNWNRRLSGDLLASNRGSVAVLAGAISNDGLVMYLPFNETSGTTTADAAPDPESNIGELRNGAIFTNTGGQFGGAVTLDGANDYVSIADSNQINLGIRAKRTISVWFNVDDKTISSRKQVIYEEGGIQRGLNIYVHNGRLYIGAWNNAASESNWQGSYISTDTIESKKWHHVAFVLNAQEGVTTLQPGALTAYLDGVAIGTAEGSQIWSHGDNIGIGAVHQGTQFHDGDVQGTARNTFKGSIDEVRVYNRALSAEEIVELQSTATNTIPVAGDDTVTTDRDVALTISAADLLGNDSDTDGDKLTIVEVTNSVNGTVSLDGSGNVVFTPTPGFVGDASFEYAVDDGKGGRDAALVTVSVADVVSNGIPVAGDDTATTNRDAALTIPITTLLSNDSDPDGDTLTVAEVTNAVNGTVTLDGSGNVAFTPTSGFVGDASFEYAVDDGKGGRDTALVTVSVTSNSGSYNIGTNLTGFSTLSSEQPFLNVFKSARPWLTQTNGVFDTKESSLLDLDANGWVRSLPAPEDAPQYTFIGTNVLAGQGSFLYPSGQYVVLFDGEGTIEYGNDGKKNVAASTPGRDVLDVTPSNRGIYLKITATDPNKTGNYIRNIRVVPASAESTYQTEIFNPTFVEKTQPYTSIRFMDWMGTNNSTQQEWSNRPTVDSAFFSKGGAPVEYLVEIANRNDQNPWFCMPHMATDEYVRNFAQYVKDNLDPNLTIYVEVSNEVWNTEFTQAQYALDKAREEFPGSTESDFNLRLDWYSKRSTEVIKIWDDVFGADNDRIIGTLSGQATFPDTIERVLQYAWSPNPLSNEEYGVDAIAGPFYFGRYLGTRQNAPEVRNWTTDPDGGLNKLFDELTRGGVLSTGYPGGALKQTSDQISAYANIANRENLQLLGVEGGNTLRGIQGIENIQEITNLFVKANQDPRMGDVYRQYFNIWQSFGGDLMAHFQNASVPGKFGSFGALENINQSGSPKYDAIVGLLSGTTASQ